MGPSSSAFVWPMRTGDSRTEPTSSVPARAVNDRSMLGATRSLPAAALLRPHRASVYCRKAGKREYSWQIGGHRGNGG